MDILGALDVLDIDLIPVTTNNVSGIGYHKGRNILAIGMNDGHLYYYMGVPKDHYDELLKYTENDISLNSYISKFIKGNYRFIQIR